MNLKKFLLVAACILTVSVPAAIAQDMQETGPDGEQQMATALKHYRSRDFQAALNDFSSVTEVAPWRADAFYLRGYCLMILRDYPQSVEAFSRAFELDPEFDPRTIYQGNRN